MKTVLITGMILTASVSGQVIKGQWCNPCAGVVNGKFGYSANARDTAAKKSKGSKKQAAPAVAIETPAPVVTISSTESSYDFAESIRHFMYANPQLAAFLMWVANVCKVLLITAALLIGLYVAIKSMTFSGGTPFVSPVAKCPSCGRAKSDEAGPCFHAFHERAQVFSNVIRELGEAK